MAIIRQMPALFLRGSIASVTMAHLTEEDRKFLAKMIAFVSNHPEMARNKARMIKELGNTIRGDYADDKLTAEQEYEIAIWRGLVDLFYHRKYTYECGHCKATTYFTKRGKPKPIERPSVPCPNCGMAEVKDRGFTDLEEGSIVDHAEMQEKYKHMTMGTPRYCSTVKHIPGERKHLNPQSVIECPKQLKKFFGEFVWNYFRQHIKENKRKEHKKKPVLIAGPADLMAIEQIKNLCTKLKVDFDCDHQVNNGFYVINLNALQTPPEFSMEMAIVRHSMNINGINVRCSSHSIEIEAKVNAPTVEVSIIKPEHVTVVDNHQTSGEEEISSSGFTLSQVSHRTSGGEKMDQDDHVATLDMSEAARKVREALPDGDCKKIYDILSQVGEYYDEFSTNYGYGIPRTNHIAEYLGITPRAVKQHKETIKIHCYANDFCLS